MSAEPQNRASRIRIAVSKALLRHVKRSPRLLAWMGKKRLEKRDGRTFDREAAAILRIDDLDAGSDLTKLSPKEARARFTEQLSIVDAPSPAHVSSEDRSFPGPGGAIRARIYWPDDLSGTQPVILYFHGGGFMIGSIATHDTLCRTLALGARCRVISIDYRLAPEEPFPAAIDDGLASFRWVVDNADDLGVDPHRICVAGDSAGGNLAAVVALRTRLDKDRPALQALIYPATDATCSLPSHRSMGEGFLLTSQMIGWYHDNYLGNDQTLKRHPDVSPLFAPEMSGAPKAIVFTAGFDPLRDEGDAYAERLREAGVQVETHEMTSLPHGFANMTGAIDAARDAVKTIASSIGKNLRTP